MSDDFDDIINSNNLNELQSDSELYNMSVKDMITGIRSVTEATMIIADFVDTYFSSLDEDNDIPRPAMSTESIVFCKELFENADKFVESLMIEDDEEEDDEDDE